MSVGIPEKCQTCPVVCGIQDRITAYNQEADRYISIAVSDTPEQLADFFQEASEQYGMDATVLFADKDLPSMLREASGIAIKAIEGKVESAEKKAAALSSHCEGPLGMRAVRGSMQYVAKICTSPELVTRTKTESAKVTRTELS